MMKKIELSMIRMTMRKKLHDDFTTTLFQICVSVFLGLTFDDMDKYDDSHVIGHMSMFYATSIKNVTIFYLKFGLEQN